MTAAPVKVVEEAKAEARRRGNTETQTSDARFDERFQLGYGLTGARWCTICTPPSLPLLSPGFRVQA